LPIARWTRLPLGKSCWSRLCLPATFLRSQSGFDLNWQLLDVASQSVRSGGAIRVASLDLIAVQTEISNEVFAALHGLSAADRIDAQIDSSRRRFAHQVRHRLPAR
jgi:hypothetical protein